MKTIIAVLLLAVCVPGTRATEKPELRARAAAMFERAIELSNLPADQSFRIRGKFWVPALKSVPPGDYELLRVAPDSMQISLSSLQYREIRVQTKSELHVWRTGASAPFPIFSVVQSLEFNFVPGMPIDSEVKAIRKANVDGVAATCVEFRKKLAKSTPNDYEFCFRDQDGALLQRKDYVYSDFANVRGKLIPRRIKRKVVDEDYFEMQVTGFFDGATAKIDIPAGARRFERCDNPTAPVLVTKIQPDYPQISRAARDQGRVIVFAIIGKDGRLYDPVVFRSRSEAMATSALAALKEWRYKPATCAGSPIEVDTSITVYFRLDGNAN